MVLFKFVVHTDRRGHPLLMTDTNSEFLTIEEFSAFSRVHERTTLRLIARRAIRVYRLGALSEYNTTEHVNPSHVRTRPSSSVSFSKPGAHAFRFAKGTAHE